MNEQPQPHHRGGRRGRPPFTEDEPPGRGRRRRSTSDEERPGRGRMGRGDVRSAVLIALLDGPGHGYELIQALEAKTEGRWRPSPGSVYPLLQMLADEGLVTAADRDGKKTFELTDAGRAEAEEHIASKGLPWEAMDRGRVEQGGLRSAVRDLHLAAKQVGLTGSTDIVGQATEIVTKARKELYRLLADS